MCICSCSKYGILVLSKHHVSELQMQIEAAPLWEHSAFAKNVVTQMPTRSLGSGRIRTCNRVDQLTAS